MSWGSVTRTISDLDMAEGTLLVWSIFMFVMGYIFGLAQGEADFRIGHESRGGPGTCLGIAECTAYIFREECTAAWVDGWQIPALQSSG